MLTSFVKVLGIVPGPVDITVTRMLPLLNWGKERQGTSIRANPFIIRVLLKVASDENSM